jgi:hypothetical protein
MTSEGVVKLGRLAAFGVALMLLFVTPQAGAQDGAWRRAEGANFIVYSRGGERPLREAVQTLEQFDALLRVLTGAQQQETIVKLPIYLLRNRSDLDVIYPGVTQWTRGFYTYQTELVAAFAIYTDNGWEGGARQILFHEYTHHFMMQHFSAAYPAWYVEGFAEYLGSIEFERRGAVVGQPSATRATALVENRTRLLPMDVMLGGVPEDDDIKDLFYAQSWLMVHYMFSSPERQQGFARYLNAVGEGVEAVAAFENAMGMSAADFRTELANYLNGRITYSVYPTPQVAESTIAITRLPRSADNLLLMNAGMRRFAFDAENGPRIEAIVSEAAQFPGDAYAVRSAAYAELWRNPVRARELALPLIEADPNDFEAQFLLGRSFLAQYENAEGPEDAAVQARRHFARAFRINAEHVPTLYGYVRTFDPPLSEEVMNVLIQAHLLAPQVDEIRFHLAVQLINNQRFEEAAIALEPIAYDPHGGEGAAQARRLLDAARRGDLSGL